MDEKNITIITSVFGAMFLVVIYFTCNLLDTQGKCGEPYTKSFE